MFPSLKNFLSFFRAILFLFIPSALFSQNFKITFLHHPSQTFYRFFRNNFSSEIRCMFLQISQCFCVFKLFLLFLS